MKGLFKQCTHSLAFRGKFILPQTGNYYKIGGCPLGFFWSHEATLCFDANHSLLWTALFPRYLFHHGIVLPFIAAIMSRVSIFLSISKPLTIQTHNCSMVSALTKCFLWWETSVAFFFFWLLQVCRLFWQDCCKMQCSHTHVSMYLSGLYIQSNSRQQGKDFFSPQVVAYLFIYIQIWQSLKHWGFETLKCCPCSHLIWYNK